MSTPHGVTGHGATGSSDELGSVLDRVRLSRLFDSDVTLALVDGQDGRILAASRGLTELAGRTLTGAGPFWDVVASDPREREQLRAAAVAGSPAAPCWIDAPNHRRLIAWSWAPVEPEASARLAIGSDITAFAASQPDHARRLKHVIEASTDGIWDYDFATAKCDFRSDRCHEILGLEAGEFDLSAESFRAVIHPADWPEVDRELRAHLAGHTWRFETECRIRRQDGSWAWVLVRALVIARDEQGKPLRMVGSIADIGRRKQAEDASRAALMERRLIVEASPLAVVHVDSEATVLSWNPAAERFFGWKEEEVVGRRIPIIPDEEYEELIEAVRNRRVPPGAERKRMRKNGSLIEVAMWMAYVDQPDGTPSGVIVEYADLTERKRLEEHIRQTQKMQALGKLAGGVAHDFNNLLTTIVGYASLMVNSREVGDRQRAQLRLVLDAGERATALARQLLTFGRRTQFQLTTSDLNETVGGALGMLSRFIGEDIEVSFEPQEGLPPIRVDREQVSHTIMNLAINAREAMPDGGKLVLKTWLDEPDAARAERLGVRPGKYAVLTVSDDGVGIPEELQDRIFEPFFTTKRGGEGSGLGLSTAYSIVQQLGGAISVESYPGQGSSFSVHLPAWEETVEGSSDISEPMAAIQAKRVVVVEDDPGVRSYVRELLESQGYAVVAFSNPTEALELPPDSYDLLVTDVVMQGMNGVEMLERLRMQRPELKVIFMSGYPDRLQQLSQRIPAGSLIAKPFAPGVLLAAVQRTLAS